MMISCVLGYFEAVNLNMHAHDNTFVLFFFSFNERGFCVFSLTRLVLTGFLGVFQASTFLFSFFFFLVRLFRKKTDKHVCVALLASQEHCLWREKKNQL